MKRWAPYLISLAIVVGLLSLVDLSRSRRLLTEPDWPAFAIGVGCYALSLVLRGLRFQILILRLVKTRTGWVGSFDLAALVAFANHVLPFRLGEAIFIVLARFRYSVSADRGLVVLVTARLYDLISLLLLFITAAMLVGSLIGPGWYAGFSVLVAVLILAAIRLDLAVRLGRLAALRIVRLVRLDRFGPVGRALAELGRAETGLAVLRHPALVAANIALSLGVWVSMIGCFHQLLTAFGLGMRFDQVAVGSMGASLSALIPINAVGNIGTLETGWVVGFVAVGMNPSDAIASGLAVHLVVIATSGIVAAWSMMRLGPSTRRGILGRAKHERVT